MKKYLNIKSVFNIITLLLLTNCTNDFDEINTNYKNPLIASPELLLPGIIKSTSYSWGGLGGEEGLVVTQHAGEMQSTNDDTYNWYPNEKPYDAGYNTLRNVNNLIEVSQVSDALKGYYGAGLVLKCLNYHFITDAYGDIPYSEASLGRTEGNFFPSFTPQSEIYEGILNDLELANEILSNVTSDISGDILFSGDILKWRKFANSLKLRLLLRILDVKPQVAIEGIKNIVNNPSDFPIFQSNEDMAALQHEIDNPPSRYDTRVGSFDSYRLSKIMEIRLKELNDSRLKVFAQPISASEKGIYSENWDDYGGILNGLNADDSESYSPTNNPDKSGSNYISRLGVLYACKECSDLASPIAAQTVIMSYSEVQFILAEATTRGIIDSKDAEVYYQNGIRASFEYYLERVKVGGWNDLAEELESLDMTVYLSQEKVNLTSEISQDLDKILLQKWISQFYVGFESWSDWRRTNRPEVTPGPGAGNDKKVPVRFLYPNDVKSTNNDNYQLAVDNIGGDNINTKLWWDVFSNN
ncbi:SusD/RagB family nutrient-binding outer membrane lipoprotein [Pseudotamlana agarivorans]|uniref:SusD/RagB family nutrient-binding outer membrane lipoprotein n=1 Tax=Pseudotamlana agarivorans TaxID=481183 RepID=UPI00083645DC|nr:SusD/RagB family nutrient-binding outer membrane lipoprotein [Tamlana agarivorans]